MSRSRRRISRIVAFILICTLAAGIFIAARKIKGARVSASQSPQGSEARRPVADDDAGGQAAPRPDAPLVPLLVTTETPGARAAAASAARAAAADLVIASPVAAAAVTLSGRPLEDAKTRLDAGDVVGARKILNDALLAGNLSDTDTAAARTLLTKMSQDALFGRRVYRDDPVCALYVLQSGDTLQKIAAANGVTWELLCRINGIPDPRKVRAGQTIKIIKGPFHAVITKSKFQMDIHLGMPGEHGSIYVAAYPVGLGKDDSTPAGTWVVDPHKKLRKPTYHGPRGEGVIAAGDPRNPLGDFWIGLAGIDGHAVGKVSYGIHGTIEPDSIGKEASMGCIRMRNEDVAIVFELLVEAKSKLIVRD